MGISLAVGQRTLDNPKQIRLISNNNFSRFGLISKFLKSRRQGLSKETIKFYNGYLTRALSLIGFNIKADTVAYFLSKLQCGNGGKHAYFRALRAFYSWLYSKKSGYNLNLQDNPMLLIEAPRVEKRLMSSVTEQQVDCLINSADTLRDKCIISLLADSGMRLTELANIKVIDINWDTYTITIWGKGNKQRKAPFTERTAILLKALVANDTTGQNIWGINKFGIQKLLKRFKENTGIPCNPHSFRRGFACNLHRKGLSTLDIMHLGGWADLSMVLRYTRSITFEDCLEHYKQVIY
jgi:integrase/recombinase XerD